MTVTIGCRRGTILFTHVQYRTCLLVRNISKLLSAENAHHWKVHTKGCTTIIRCRSLRAPSLSCTREVHLCPAVVRGLSLRFVGSLESCVLRRSRRDFEDRTPTDSRLYPSLINCPEMLNRTLSGPTAHHAEGDLLPTFLLRNRSLLPVSYRSFNGADAYRCGSAGRGSRTQRILKHEQAGCRSSSAGVASFGALLAVRKLEFWLLDENPISLTRS